MHVRNVAVIIAERKAIQSMFGRADNWLPQGVNKVLYLTPEQAASILSKRRLELLAAIKRYPQATVTQLTRLLDRKQEAVSRDLSKLRFLGLVDDPTSKERLGCPDAKPAPLALSLA